eukprot:TRINITY_DN1591_c0_g1_i1.p1 TRINITY_DN1591_c0_g1~~TRINITY_DN1591_c0_g1_i1.p1  ORF type:complete len:405 (-),score=37.44 TRINITY_DN1591_c0_g1_i1:41-1219(-)
MSAPPTPNNGSSNLRDSRGSTGSGGYSPPNRNRKGTLGAHRVTRQGSGGAITIIESNRPFIAEDDSNGGLPSFPTSESPMQRRLKPTKSEDLPRRSAQPPTNSQFPQANDQEEDPYVPLPVPCSYPPAPASFKFTNNVAPWSGRDSDSNYETLPPYSQLAEESDGDYGALPHVLNMRRSVPSTSELDEDNYGALPHVHNIRTVPASSELDEDNYGALPALGLSSSHSSLMTPTQTTMAQQRLSLQPQRSSPVRTLTNSSNTIPGPSPSSALYGSRGSYSPPAPMGHTSLAYTRSSIQKGSRSPTASSNAIRVNGPLSSSGRSHSQTATVGRVSPDYGSNHMPTQRTSLPQMESDVEDSYAQLPSIIAQVGYNRVYEENPYGELPAFSTVQYK